ncbi:di-heme oxidoreductase (putative peroxidase) [Roseiarcus fermentans]|uniref:Di-heme oxidoreductase (Putative peroxidase) n=1 Tax=Roseiarcus fermentans TaxID=1473586 RepID=A0A366F5F9_9HYPH|nr:di-heme oxidoredictase family protein [Roseiarcus fermentans]RBP09200.1 di-heme oxidoreductase (putative peroxidase) [Roseiarcus fermentans]
MKRALGVLAAARAVAFLVAVGPAAAGSWDERVFPPGAHVDFAAAAAAGPAALPALVERGRDLFKAKFTTLDGAGRPKATQAIIPTRRKSGVNPPFTRTSGPDSNSCFGCHNDPVVGGSGDVVANVFVSEGFESAQFDTIDPSFSSERHTIALTGAGLVELLAREMTADLQAIRAGAVGEACRSGKDVRADLVSKGVRFGWIVAHPDGIVDLDSVDGVDADLVVRPFSRKGVFTSLRQFTINALNVHHGMEASERFGVRWTGTHDFSESGVPDAITPGDVSALVAFQATLPPPTVRANLPDDWRAAAEAGAKRFDAIGCPSCHVKTLPLKSMVFTDPAPYDMAGTLRPGEVGAPIVVDLSTLPFAKTLQKNDKGEWLIPLMSDLKRHLVVDEQVNALGNELQAQRFVERDVFLTPRLWGVGSTAPYGHNGSFRMLDEIIAAHGGDARFARDQYLALEPGERDAVVAYLRSLVIEAP